MRRLMIIMTLIGMMSFVFGQKPANYDDQLKGLYENTIELISVDELMNEMRANPGILLLDTREIDEYKVSHIQGARNIGFSNFSFESMQNVPKDTEIVVYCSLGVRSEQVGEKLMESGYRNVKNLFGGIFEWVYQDQLILDEEENPTHKVHTYDEDWSKWLIKGEKIY